MCDVHQSEDGKAFDHTLEHKIRVVFSEDNLDERNSDEDPVWDQQKCICFWVEMF